MFVSEDPYKDASDDTLQSIALKSIFDNKLNLHIDYSPTRYNMKQVYRELKVLRQWIDTKENIHPRLLKHYNSWYEFYKGKAAEANEKAEKHHKEQVINKFAEIAKSRNEY